MPTTRFLILISLIIVISSQLFSQQQIRQTEQLPPIDISQINPEAYETGKFRIKFKAVAEKQLEAPKNLKSQSGVAVTGIKEVEALSLQFHVKKGKALLSDLYNSPLKSATLQTERHKKFGLHLWYEFETGKDVNLQELIKQYEKLESIEIVEPVFRIVPIKQVNNPIHTSAQLHPIQQNQIPDDEKFPQQWHFHNTGQNNGQEDSDIDLPEAWESIQGNPDVIVAVIDQGVDFNHPDLAGNIWPGIGPEGESTLPGDHGTHVAGTIAALNNNAIGVSGIAGGSGNNDGVRIMSLDLFNGQHEMSTLEMNVWAADNGAAISQNSWGYMGPDYYNQSDLDGIDYFNEYGGGDIMEGGITFFAAGNDSDDGNWYPGCYEGAIAVAATNNNDQISWYSNYGDWVDISAPGGETSTTFQAGVLSTVANGDYDFYQGTSMACPHVSGVAALVLSQAPGFLTNEELTNIILSSVDDHYVSNPGYEGLMGTGRVNAFKAIEMAQEYLGNVRNPSSFTAQSQSETSILLNWDLNENENQVMIAMSANREFGSPEDGTSYTTEQQLQGGGVIKYVGNNLTMELQDLEKNTTYYFRIWSFDKNKEYSYGRSSQSKTFAPQLAISTLLIDYGQVYIGYPKSQFIEIQNNGESELIISETIFSSDEFSSPQIPTSVQPGETHSWEIIFDPTQTQSYSENLTFNTNAPDSENISVALTGDVSDQIPLLVYSPSEIEETLNSGAFATRFIELTNNGEGNLNFDVEIQEEQSALAANDSAPFPPATKDYIPVTKGQLIERLYTNREIKESGGSKEAGYLWSTTPIDWYDTSDGTKIILGDDDSENDIPLGFSFNYYENTYSSINVKSNGWVSFSNTYVWYPECIPGGSGTISPFGMDLLPDANSYIAYKVFGTEPSRKFVVEYNNIPLYSSNTRNTFQIVFSEGKNTILFQYKEVGITPYVVGIENIDGSKGIGNCGLEETFLNPEIITNNLGIRFSPASWGNISASTGTIEPGKSTTLALRIDATNLVENTYSSDILITNNDPRMEVVTIPLTLNVTGVPDFLVHSDTVFLAPTYLGTTSSASFTIDNTNGTGTLRISNITTSGPPYEIETIPETVSPEVTETIHILFSPDQKNHYNGSFTIFSNDPDIPEKTITVFGEGIIAPNISSSPERFDIEIFAGDSCNRTLTISNGAANSIPLEVKINLETSKAPQGTAKLIAGTPTELKSFAPAAGIGTPKYTQSNPVPKSGNGFNVLFLTTMGESGINFHQAIENLPNIHKVDSVDISAQTPNVEYLRLYDVVLLATNAPIASADILGDILAEYIDLGGNLCVLNGALSAGGGWTLSGRITESGYLPVEINDFTFSLTSCNSFSEHPLTRNLTLLETTTYSHTVPQGEGVELGTFDSGYSCITYNPEKPIVAINMFPSNDYYNDELITLMSNTIEWLGKHNQWMRADKNALSIEENTSQEVNLTFDASGLEPGEYTGNIQLNSNAPATSGLSIPVTFNVTEAPGISIDHAEFDFSEVAIGVRSSIPREISNTGSSPLEITTLNVSGQYFDCNETAPVTIAPGETTYLNISFTPESPVEENGQLTIVSNDPTDSEIIINLSGTGYHAAKIDVTPLSLNEQITEGENIHKTISISNPGIGEALNYSLTVEYHNNDSETIGGGPDAGNYIWNQAEIAPFDFSGAVEIPLNDDDYEGNIPLGFNFTYYNEEFSTVNIMSNGWISFTTYDSWFPSCIPGSLDAIAPFAKDLNTYNDNSIRYKTTGTAPNRQFAIDYQTSLYGTTDLIHFQVILEEKTNKIRFQYIEVSDSPENVGISSPNGTTGIGSCANDSLYISTDLVTSGTAIEFSNVPKNWLSVTPDAGIIEQSGHTNIEVLMPTTNLPAGTYNATLVVEHNEPLKLPLNIPVTLTIDELKRYSLTFNYQNQFAEPVNDVKISFNGSQELEGISQFTLLPAGIYEYSVTKDGYSQGENASGEIAIETSDVTIDVTLNAMLHQIELITYPAGSGTVNGAGNYYTDQMVSLKAFPAAGFQFFNWVGQDNSIVSEQASYSFSMPPRDITLTGNFGVFSSLKNLQDSKIYVYPNPAEDVIQVRITNPNQVKSIEILNSKGQLMKKSQGRENETFTINIGNFNPGTYILKVKYINELRYFKFVKK